MHQISRTTFHLADPGSTRTIYEIAKWGHTEEMARDVARMWAQGTIQDRMTIFRNVMTDNLANRAEMLAPGWTETAEGQEALARIGDGIDHAFGGIDGGRTTPWGFDQEGRIISKMPMKGQTVSVPILERATINIPMPDYLTFDRNLKALTGHGELYGAADDFLYQHFTQNVFKRWVLATGGFALRVSTGELLPQVMRHPVGVFKAKVSASLTKRGWTLEAGEDEHILAPIARFMARRVNLGDEEIEWLANAHQAHGSHMVASGVSAGHEAGHEIIGAEEYINDTLYNLKKEVPKRTRLTEDIEAWGPDHDDHWVYWQKQVIDMTEKSPAAQAAARAYRDVIMPEPEVVTKSLADVKPGDRIRLPGQKK